MWTHVEGMEGRKLKLYALSTCGWCKKTKDLLGENGVAYDYVFVDLLSSADKDSAIAEMEKMVSDLAFPLLVIDEELSIQGYKPEDIQVAIHG